MVDASQMDRLCQRISASFPSHMLTEDQRQRVLDFLANRFEVHPDVATHIGQVQQATTQLASGLATWVPRITHAEQLYQIEATAGSGKTQLALALLAQAAAQGLKARYVCFNRPLADHLARLAPARCEVTTFHQLCRDHAEGQGLILDFADPKVFERITQQYLQDAAALPARLGLSPAQVQRQVVLHTAGAVENVAAAHGLGQGAAGHFHHRQQFGPLGRAQALDGLQLFRPGLQQPSVAAAALQHLLRFHPGLRVQDTLDALNVRVRVNGSGERPDPDQGESRPPIH
jgi:hypothetical protein